MPFKMDSQPMRKGNLRYDGQPGGAAPPATNGSLNFTNANNAVLIGVVLGGYL